MKNFKKSNSRRNFGENRDRSPKAERIMHTSVCAQCRESCQVPFKPRGDKPVYCNSCFGGRLDSSRDTRNNFSKPREFRGEKPSLSLNNSKLIGKIDELIDKLDQVVRLMAVKIEAPQKKLSSLKKK